MVVTGKTICASWRARYSMVSVAFTKDASSSCRSAMRPSVSPTTRNGVLVPGIFRIFLGKVFGESTPLRDNSCQTEQIFGRFALLGFLQLLEIIQTDQHDLW